MKSSPFTEVRTVSGTVNTPDEHFFFDGPGRIRVNINDGQPDVLNATVAHSVSGRLTGNVKVISIKGSNDWYSLRSTGPKSTNKVTVYVKGSALVVIDGVSTDVRTLHRENA